MKKFSAKHKNSSLIGFTLAEVLITLGIIGVVAAMTISVLVNNAQKQGDAAKLKKIYSALNQAFLNMESDSQCPGDLACTGFFDGTVTQTISENVAAALSGQIKTIKACAWAEAGCFATPISSLNDTLTYAAPNGMKFITSDGISFLIYDLAGNCDMSTYELCATIFVDTNALSAPNRWGKDVFLLYLTRSGKILGHGYDNNWKISENTVGLNCRTDATSAGKGCAGRIIEEGWQINYY